MSSNKTQSSEKSNQSEKKKKGKKNKKGTLGSAFNAADSDKDSDPDPFFAGCSVCINIDETTFCEIEGESFSASSLNNRDCYSLDGHANICIFNNAKVLTNLREIKIPKRVKGIGGTVQHYNTIGNHPIFGEVIYDPNNEYNLVGQPVLRKLGLLIRISADNSFIDVVDGKTENLVMHFRLDESDGFYKSPMFPSTPEKTFVASPHSLIKPVHNRAEKLKLYTQDQIERAQRVAVLHKGLMHASPDAMIRFLNSPSLINCDLSAQDVKNWVDIEGECSVCLRAKPLPIKGSNPTYKQEIIVAPGQHIMGDIVFMFKVPYLFTKDQISGTISITRLLGKEGPYVQSGLETIFNWYKSHLRVTQYFSSDYEAVFRSLEGWLNKNGIHYNSSLPGEHLRSLERSMRRVREAIRSGRIELEFRLPRFMAPYLMFHVVECMNFVPNARSAPLSPLEMVTGEKVNFRTDLLTVFGQLVLTKNASTTSGSTVEVQEIGLALGRCRNAKGSVWVYFKGHEKPVSRRPLKILPMTKDWIDYLNDQADKKPYQDADFFEFREGIIATPEEIEEQRQAEKEQRLADEEGSQSPSSFGTIPPIIEEPLVEKQEKIQIQPNSPKMNLPKPDPQQVKGPPIPTPNHSPTVIPTSPSNKPSERQPTATPESAKRRVSFGPAQPAKIPESVIPEPIPAQPPPILKSPSSNKDNKVSADLSKDNIVNYRRVPKPSLKYANTAVVDMIKQNFFGEFDSGNEEDLPDNLFGYFADHEPLQEYVVMQITLNAALKTEYSKPAEECAIKEAKNVIGHRVWSYLKTINDREPSIHKSVMPCQMLVKDKWDSRGNFLLWKGRLAAGGNRTDPNSYSPFDKSSPTAHLDAVYAWLSVAQRYKMQVESADVPSAYINAPLKKGQKHVMRVNKIIAKYVCIADPEARKFIQSDGSLLVQLEKALYGLPESGKVWHEFFIGILKKIGYEQLKGDTCCWRRIEFRNNIPISYSFLLIYVDDILHIFGGEENGKKIHKRFHSSLQKEGLPELKTNILLKDEPVNFLGLNISRVPDGRLHVSQPGYTKSIIANFPVRMNKSLRKRQSSLPQKFSTRKLSSDDEKLLNAEQKSFFLKWVQTLAWLNRTRPDISCAVAYKQTCCANPREIDLDDLEFIVGYLAEFPLLGIFINVDSWDLTLWVDASWAPHSDRKSHTGAAVTVGKINLTSIIWKSCKQKIVAASSTEAELIAASDMIDLAFVAKMYLEFLNVQIPMPIRVMQDNTSAITIAYLARPSLSSRRRFIDIRYFWFKQFLDSSAIKMIYCPGEEQMADFLASVRSGERFHFVRIKMMGKTK